MAAQRQSRQPEEAGRQEHGLTELGRALVGEVLGDEVASAGGGEALAGGALVSLDLRDLVQDDNGEIVLYNDSGFSAIGIEADRAVVAQGQAEAHVTAAGEDVSGFRFVAFEGGPTLYYQDGVELVVHAEAT